MLERLSGEFGLRSTNAECEQYDAFFSVYMREDVANGALDKFVAAVRDFNDYALATTHLHEKFVKCRKVLNVLKCIERELVLKLPCVECANFKHCTYTKDGRLLPCVEVRMLINFYNHSMLNEYEVYNAVSSWFGGALPEGSNSPQRSYVLASISSAFEKHAGFKVDRIMHSATGSQVAHDVMFFQPLRRVACGQDCYTFKDGINLDVSTRFGVRRATTFFTMPADVALANKQLYYFPMSDGLPNAANEERRAAANINQKCEVRLSAIELADSLGAANLHDVIEEVRNKLQLHEMHESQHFPHYHSRSDSNHF